jgi:hypothetical protein
MSKYQRVFYINGEIVPGHDTGAEWVGFDGYGDVDRPVRTSMRVRYAGSTRVVWLTAWARGGLYYVRVKGQPVDVRVAHDVVSA